jgi:polar amino acid transport system permease protein
MEIFNMIMRILEGLGNTLSIYLFTLVISIILGLILAVCRVSTSITWLRKGIDIYTYILRGTPLMLQLFFVYFGLRGVSFIVGEYTIKPFAMLTTFTSALLAFILNYTAYFIEIFRGGIQAVEKGQYEAATALGLNYKQCMYYIVIPQSLHAVLPSLANEAITLVKDTALVASIAMPDLLRNSREIVLAKGTLLPFVIVAIIYLLLVSVIIGLVKRIEKKLSTQFG